MPSAKRVVESLLGRAGIAVDGPAPWDIQVHEDHFYGRVLGQANLGLGEAYMDGWWDCARVDDLVCRLLQARLDRQVRGSPRLLLRALPAVVLNRQTLRGARCVARRHYDLDEEFFRSFLDPHMQYSCACFQDGDGLDQAQVRKMELVCAKLGLGPGDRLLDIGCGWGGLARFAARTRGCEVTAVNISREQIRHARERCAGLPVTVLEQDYREIRGCFDKIVSVGMFEHVGLDNHRAFMKAAHGLLAEGGVFLLHTIGSNASQRTCDPWIEKHIFPRGLLPSIAQIGRAAEGLFVIEDWHNLGPHYDRTLLAWNRNFQAAWDGLKDRFDQTFKRMWEYYLLSCAGAFRARSIQLWQIVFTREGTPQPACRF